MKNRRQPIALVALLAVAAIAGSGSAHASCGTGKLLGNSYTIENRTGETRWVFIGAGSEATSSSTWKRVEIPSREVVEVPYSLGDRAVVVNVVDGEKKADAYSMDCESRYFLSNGRQRDVVRLVKYGG